MVFVSGRPYRKELAGIRNGNMRVMGFSHTYNKSSYWNCKCDCGNEVVLRSDEVKAKKHQSCGCKYVHPNKTHGKKKTKLYRVWSSMKERCLNPDHHAYENYGGRGITVCRRWHKFENFYADMGEPESGMTLDRMNNNKGYSPRNCRWADWKTQNRNTTRNRMIKYKGKTRSISEWAEIYGIEAYLLRQRLSRNWTMGKALKTPKMK